MNHFVYAHIHDNILFIVTPEISINLVINLIIISVSNSQKCTNFLHIRIYIIYTRI